MQSDKDREEFEEWFSRTYPLTSRESTQTEVLCKMIAEQAWQASRESLVIDLSGCEEELHDGGAYYSQYRVDEAIEAAGLKVTP